MRINFRKNKIRGARQPGVEFVEEATGPGQPGSSDEFFDGPPEDNSGNPLEGQLDRQVEKGRNGPTRASGAAADETAPEVSAPAEPPEAPAPTEPREAPAPAARADHGESLEATAILGRLTSMDARLNTMNNVLRRQAEEIADMTERRIYSRLMEPARKLAEMHDELVAEMALGSSAGVSDDDAGDLAYVLDGIVDVLETMGVEIVEVRPGDSYDANIHRRTRIEVVEDPGLHRTVGNLPRPMHHYRFTRAEPPIVVAAAKVAVRKLTDDEAPRDEAGSGRREPRSNDHRPPAPGTEGRTTNENEGKTQ